MNEELTTQEKEELEQQEKEQAEQVSETEDEKYERLIAEGKSENVIGELKRYKKELDEIKEKQATQETVQKPPGSTQQQPDSTPQFIKDYENQMIALKQSQEVIKVNIDFMKQMAAGVTSYNLNKIKSKLYKDDIRSMVETFKSNPDTKFVIVKLEKEFKEQMGKFDPELWSDKELAESVLGKLVMKNQEELFGSGKGKEAGESENPTETKDNVSGSPSTGGISEKELDEFALEIGIDASSPEARKKLRAGLAAKKTALKNKDKQK